METEKFMEALTFILSICIPVVLLFFVFIRVFPGMAETPQIFDDFIIENVSSAGYNKSAELMLFRVIAMICMALTLLLVFALMRLTRNRQSGPMRKFSQEQEALLTAALIALFAFAGHFIVFGKADTACGLGLIVVLLTALWHKLTKESAKELLLLPVLSYYAVLAVLTVLVRISPVFALSQQTIFLVAGMTALILFAVSRIRFLSIHRVLLVLQVIIPVLLVLFFVDSYVYRGTLQRIPYAPFYYIFFGGLLFSFVLMAVLHLLKHIKKADTLSPGKLIHPITAITVFIYNSCSACPIYAQPDQHHHGEQLIPWQQIVSLGQTAYDEYTPVSGLFPLVNGFIQNILLGGTVSDYSPAVSIMVVLFCIVTMYLICKHVGGAYGLLFAVFFALPSYNRQYMVLPLLLLLFLTSLQNRPGLWLKTWIFSCFLAGLYYPLYGAAVLLGTLPLGIAVFYRYMKDTDWKTTRKQPLFYIGWLLCLFPVVLCLPLLLRMVSHTLVYSGQTTLADGISLYGQNSPDFFLPYLAGTHESLRLMLYYGLRFFLPMLPLIVACALFAIAYFKKQRAEKSRSHAFLFGLIAMVISLAVSYTYTLVRADVNMILSRTAPVLVAVAGMFLPVLLLSHGAKHFSLPVRAVTIAACFALPMLLYHQVSAMKFPDMWVYPNGEAALVMDDEDKLFAAYEVPESFISMKEIDLPDTTMLGNGFMVADQIHYLTSYAAVMEKCRAMQPDTYYMGMDGQGFYYYLNAKACATGFIQAGKGYDAQQRLLETIKTKQPVIFLLEPQASYHIFYYVLTGDYIYCAADRAFYPAKLYAMLYPENASGDDFRQEAAATDLGLSPASFGNSFHTLSARLSETSLKAGDALSPATVSGREYDILYLRLPKTLSAQSASVKITFTCDDSSYEGANVTCKTGDGTLLIPMGMNACWLLSNNSDIVLTFYGAEGTEIKQIPLEQCTAEGLECIFYELKK